MDYDREFLSGTLTVLILGLLGERAMYGSEILREADRRSASHLKMKEGSLYPALHKMERGGLLKAEWRTDAAGRERKYYALTARGKRQAQSKRAQWERITAALRSVLGGVSTGAGKPVS
jgi:PadR family transcriptional regulator, regulatory protein PadR